MNARAANALIFPALGDPLTRIEIGTSTAHDQGPQGMGVSRCGFQDLGPNPMQHAQDSSCVKPANMKHARARVLAFLAKFVRDS